MKVFSFALHWFEVDPKNAHCLYLILELDSSSRLNVIELWPYDKAQLSHPRTSHTNTLVYCFSCLLEQNSCWLSVSCWLRTNLLNWRQIKLLHKTIRVYLENSNWNYKKEPSEKERKMRLSEIMTFPEGPNDIEKCDSSFLSESKECVTYPISVENYNAMQNDEISEQLWWQNLIIILSDNCCVWYGVD